MAKHCPASRPPVDNIAKSGLFDAMRSGVSVADNPLYKAMDTLYRHKPWLLFSPWSKQLDVLKADYEIRLLPWGNRCLGAESEIYDPVAGRNRVISEIAEDFHVLAFDGAGYQIATAEKPFKKGPVAPIYRIEMSSGEHFTASGEHLVLTSSGYRAISSLRPGFGVFLPESNSGIFPLVHSSDDPRSSSITEDSPGGYRSLPHFYDGQLPYEIDTYRLSAPLQADVLIPSDSALQTGGPGHRQAHIRPYRHSAPLSSTDDHYQSGGQFAECGCDVACIDSRRCSGSTQLSAQSPYESLTRPQPDVGPFQCYNVPYSAFSCSIITSITYLREDYKYDCHVPIYNNYYAGGAIHHNTGKTTVGACEAVMAAMGQHPYLQYPPPPFDIWAVSVNYKQMRGSVMPALEGDAYHHRMLPWTAKLDKQNNTYVLPGGSRIILKSCDSGRASFQGSAPGLIWLDEEIPEDIIRELLMRIAPGYQRRIIWTMTAVTGLSYAYDQLYVPWMSGDPNVWCCEASIYDVPFYTEEQIQAVVDRFPAESREIKVRLHGGFIDLTGESVFADDTIRYYKDQVCEPEELLRFDVDKPMPDNKLETYIATGGEDWHVKVWQRPRAIRDYVIGADIMEGKMSNPNDPDSPRDWNYVVVMDRRTKEVVATVHSRVDPITIGKIMWHLGHWYNYAWLSPEINSAGIACLGALTGKAGLPPYIRLYQRRVDFDEWNPDIANDDLGWRTVEMTRGKLVYDMRQILSRDKETGQFLVSIHDKILVDEMEAFQRSKNGKPEAVRGKHDDAVMAFGITLQLDIYCPHGKDMEIPAETGSHPEPTKRLAYEGDRRRFNLAEYQNIG